MTKRSILPDLRQTGKINCSNCRCVHKLDELEKESLHGVELYICTKSKVLLAYSVPDGRVIPVTGTSVG